jgi:hypothetical protein
MQKQADSAGYEDKNKEEQYQEVIGHSVFGSDRALS